MKKVTIVPKEKDNFQFIEELERVGESWLFLHKNVLEELRLSADSCEPQESGWYLLWGESPSKELETEPGSLWFPLKLLIDNKKGFVYLRENVEDPEEVFFLKME